MEVEGIGKVHYDLAYGGAFYASVAMKQHNLNFDLSTKSYQELSRNGMNIKNAVMKGGSEIQHPIEADLNFLFGTIFIGDSDTPKIDSKNVYIFAKGEIDRCSTGSGASGRIAIHSSRKEIKPGETMRIESIIGSVFKGAVVSKGDNGPFKAVIPQVEGNAYIIRKHTFCIDPCDSMKNGFILR
jgi:proline racemase